MFLLLVRLPSSLLARMTFGANRTNIFWIPLMVQFMLFPADMNFASTPPLYFWPWIIEVGAILGILHWMSRKDPGLFSKAA